MTTGTAAQWETEKEYFQCLMSRSLRVSDLPRIVKYSSCALSVIPYTKCCLVCEYKYKFATIGWCHSK